MLRSIIVAGLVLFFASFVIDAKCSGEDRPWWGGYGGLGWTDSHHDNHFDTGVIMGGAGRLLLEPIAPGKSHLYKIGCATIGTAFWMVTFERIVANDPKVWGWKYPCHEVLARIDGVRPTDVHDSRAGIRSQRCAMR